MTTTSLAGPVPLSRVWSGSRVLAEDLTGEDLADVLDLANAGITGHSMGGHGALTLFLKNPGKYRSISAFSAICNPSRCPWGEKAFKGYLGEDKEEWKKHDATELIKG